MSGDGAVEPGLVVHTIRGTGTVVAIRKISPLLVREVQRANPPPKPPMQTVDYGDGEVREEPNPADPAHQEALAAHRALIEEQTMRLVLLRGVVVQMTPAREAAVAELRAFMREEYGHELDPNDRLVYLSYIAIGTGEDLHDLAQAVFRRSQPTEGAVAEAVETFRPAIQGA